MLEAAIRFRETICTTVTDLDAAFRRLQHLEVAMWLVASRRVVGAVLDLTELAEQATAALMMLGHGWVGGSSAEWHTRWNEALDDLLGQYPGSAPRSPSPRAKDAAARLTVGRAPRRFRRLIPPRLRFATSNSTALLATKRAEEITGLSVTATTDERVRQVAVPGGALMTVAADELPREGQRDAKLRWRQAVATAWATTVSGGGSAVLIGTEAGRES